MQTELEALESGVDYRFQDPYVLRRALTHKSHAHEKSTAAGEDGLKDNEQLEFLGDAVLGFLVSDSLVKHFPLLPEGQLSKLKAHLVSSTHLHQVAQNLSLGNHLLLGRGEEMSGGRQKKALLANAVEALIAAIYLDGGIEPARRFVAQHIIGDLDELVEGAQILYVDFKGALQEFVQARGLPQPRYMIVKERGPEHAKTFTVEVRVGTDWSGHAEALSKKSAGQKAAQTLLAKLMAETSTPGPVT
jgi:ribonuclease-3